VNEGICLAIITSDEAEALRRVEELHCARRAFARQFTTAARGAASAWCFITITTWCEFFNWHWLAFDLQIDGGDFAVAFNEGEAERLARSQTGEADLFHSADVNEDVFAAIIAGHKAEALASIEELYAAGAFTDNLCGHTATTVAAAEAAAAATATVAAAEAAAAAATIAAAEAAATVTITAAEAATTTVIAETATVATTIAVTAEGCRFETLETTPKIIAPAASTVTTAIFVETHWLLFAFSTSTPHSIGALRRTEDAVHPERGLTRAITYEYINHSSALRE
jgi:hypothetical protein